MSEQRVPYQAGAPAEQPLLCVVCGEGAGERGDVRVRVVEVQREILMGDPFRLAGRVLVSLCDACAVSDVAGALGPGEGVTLWCQNPK